MLGGASLLLYAAVNRVECAYGAYPLQSSGFALYPAVFALYFLALRAVWLNRALRLPIRPAAGLALGAAVAFRLAMLAGPVPDNYDNNRHLWEGRVLRAGINTFRAAPTSPIYDGLRAQLKAEGNPLYENMCPPENSPLERNVADLQRWLTGVRTTYGLVACAIWAAISFLPVDGVLGLRIVMTLFDLGTCVLLFMLLRHLGRNPLWAMVYAWNPLTLNSYADRGQCDAAIAFFVVLAAWLVITRRAAAAGIAFAFAVGVKVSPLLAVLPFIRYGRGRFTAGFLVALAAVMAPIVAAGREGITGYVAFASLWHGNDSIFSLLALGLQPLSGHLDPSKVARLIVSGAAVLYALWRTIRKHPDSPQWLLENVALILAASALLSPVLYPWYVCAMLAFLCFSFSSGLVLLTAAMMMWYLNFTYDSLSLPHWLAALPTVYFEPWRWLGYIPVYALLIARRPIGADKDGGPSGGVAF
jgi:hypothetical protein